MFARYLSASAHYSLDRNWQTFVFGRYDRLNDAAKDSPMAGQSYSAIFGGGVLYKF